MAAAFRQLYRPFIGVRARKLYEHHEGAGYSHSPDAVRDRLGVVIVMGHGREMVLRALRSLVPQCEALQEVESRVVVVDTTSTTGTQDAVRHEFPQVTVIANPEAAGVARAFNEGLRHLGFPTYVLLTQDDVEVSAGALAQMISNLRGRSSAAGIIASLMNPDGTAQSQRLAIVELFPRLLRRPDFVTLVGTTCALIRGEVFFDVGFYDERLSHYEDVDWSLSAKRKGYKFLYLPEATVVHRRHAAVGSSDLAFTDRSVPALLLAYKHAGRRWAVLLYWAQRIRGIWLALRWRNDGAMLSQINEARDQAESLCRRFREENQRPQLL
jgi:GT2 family glycosyltransferase